MATTAPPTTAQLPGRAVSAHLEGRDTERDDLISAMGGDDRIALIRQLNELVELLGWICADCGKLVEPGSGYSSINAADSKPAVTYHSVCGPNRGPWDDAWYVANPEGGK